MSFDKFKNSHINGDWIDSAPTDVCTGLGDQLPWEIAADVSD
jgi:hypothetical protein